MLHRKGANILSYEIYRTGFHDKGADAAIKFQYFITGKSRNLLSLAGKKGQIEIAMIAGTIVVFVIVLIYSSFTSYVSKYSRTNRLIRTIDLTLIESENMKTTYTHHESNGISQISIEPEAQTERFIYDLLELNLIGNGLGSCQITAAAVDQIEFNSDTNSLYRVPVVSVAVEDQQHKMLLDKVSALRVIHPEDLPES